MTRERDTKPQAGRPVRRRTAKRQICESPDPRPQAGGFCERLAVALRAIRKEELGVSRRRASELTGFSNYALRRAESAATVGRMDYLNVVALLARYNECMSAQDRRLDMVVTIGEPERTTRISLITGMESSVEPRIVRSRDLVGTPPIGKRK